MKSTTKKSKTLLMLLLVATLPVSLTACNKKTETVQSVTETAQTTTETAGLWGNAIYLTDTELGQGSKNLIVEVAAEDRLVKFTIHTDEATVGGALFENNLITGDEGEYGLYIKTVNGILADYDVDQSYWAFYVDGEYAMAGVDSTQIAEESVYKLEYTK